jgi:hypothetical protein
MPLPGACFRASGAGGSLGDARFWMAASGVASGSIFSSKDEPEGEQ